LGHFWGTLGRVTGTSGHFICPGKSPVISKT